jgi:hypothetical protein
MTEQQRPPPRKVLDQAFELQAERERAREHAARDEAWRKAAGELGLEHDLYDEARLLVAQREAAEAAAQAQRRRAGAAALIGLAATAGMLAALWALWPTPTPPWSDDLTGGAARWALDVSPGTEASVSWEGDAAHVTVGRFQPGADGRYVVNLDTTLPTADLSDYSELTVRVQGQGLGNVRAYLEGPDERWRSPPIPVTSSPVEHAVPLDAFEHQRREGGGWKVVPWTHPGRVPGLSFKLGHYINPPEQSGDIQLDDVGLR